MGRYYTGTKLNPKNYILSEREKVRTMNDIQYIYDAAGHKKSVIVPVELWERTLQVQNPRPTPCNPQEYYGIYKDVIKDPASVARSLRTEWNRV